MKDNPERPSDADLANTIRKAQETLNNAIKEAAQHGLKIEVEIQNNASLARGYTPYVVTAISRSL